MTANNATYKTRSTFALMGGISFSMVLISALALSPSRAWGGYAQSIESFTPGSPIHSIAPIENILGAPDTTYNPWDSTGSIGHMGSVTVDMGQTGFTDVPGDDIFLWYGGFTTPSYNEVLEGCRVEVSMDGLEFFFVGELPYGGIVGSPVAPLSRGLDISDSGLAHARYIRVWDTGTDVDAGGLELNAIEAIPEPMTLSLLALGGLAMLRRRRSC